MTHAYFISGWECDWYPAVSGGVVTAGFLWVWYWDPTLLTFIALMGLVLTLVDYVGPKIINQVSGKIAILHVEKNALLTYAVCHRCMATTLGLEQKNRNSTKYVER